MLADVTLVDEVGSIVFRDPRLHNSRISVNAEHGTIFLRGELESPELIEELERAVRAVAGVREVESLLHPYGHAGPASHRREAAPRRREDLTPRRDRAGAKGITVYRDSSGQGSC